MSEFIDVRKKARQIVTDPYGFKRKKLHNEYEITDEIIEECYEIAARTVKQHGKRYLPIFERMHRERETRLKNRSMMDMALEVASLS